MATKSASFVSISALWTAFATTLMSAGIWVPAYWRLLANMSPCGRISKLHIVTMPKLFPPPRRAHYKPGCEVELVTTNLPDAVTCKTLIVRVVADTASQERLEAKRNEEGSRKHLQMKQDRLQRDHDGHQVQLVEKSEQGKEGLQTRRALIGFALAAPRRRRQKATCPITPATCRCTYLFARGTERRTRCSSLLYRC
jgi:hypothetical protein